MLFASCHKMIYNTGLFPIYDKIRVMGHKDRIRSVERTVKA